MPGILEIIAFFVIPVLAVVVIYQRIRRLPKPDDRRPPLAGSTESKVPAKHSNTWWFCVAAVSLTALLSLLYFLPGEAKTEFLHNGSVDSWLSRCIDFLVKKQ